MFHSRLPWTSGFSLFARFRVSFDRHVRTVDINLIQLKINDLPPLDEAPASEPAVPDVSVDEPVDAAEEPAADEAMTDEPESGAPE